MTLLKLELRRNAISNALSTINIALVISILMITCIQKPTLVNGQKRIIGGKIVPTKTVKNIRKYPSFAIGRNCGATLIYPDILLSAAQCNKSTAFRNRVRIGGNRRDGSDAITIVSSLFYVTHPQYEIDMSTDNVYNDIMIIKLTSPVPDTIPIQLLNFDSTIPEDGTTVVAIGLGKTTSNTTTLKEASMEIYNTTTCNQQHYEGQLETDTIFCASVSERGPNGFYNATCHGDTGGPVYMMDDTIPVQIGIASYGRKCGFTGIPSVYTRLSSYEEWLRDMICAYTSVRPLPNYCDNRPSNLIPPPIFAPIGTTPQIPTDLVPGSPTAEPSEFVVLSVVSPVVALPVAPSPLKVPSSVGAMPVNATSPVVAPPVMEPSIVAASPVVAPSSGVVPASIVILSPVKASPVPATVPTLAPAATAPITASVPASAPVSSPVSSPVSLPASAPAPAPISAPASTPASAPVSSPASTPVSAPVSDPVSAPLSAPVSAPVSVPVSSPVSSPVSAPVSVPVSPSVTTPILIPVIPNSSLETTPPTRRPVVSIGSPQQITWNVNINLNVTMTQPRPMMTAGSNRPILGVVGSPTTAGTQPTTIINNNNPNPISSKKMKMVGGMGFKGMKDGKQQVVSSNNFNNNPTLNTKMMKRN